MQSRNISPKKSKSSAANPTLDRKKSSSQPPPLPPWSSSATRQLEDNQVSLNLKRILIEYAASGSDASKYELDFFTATLRQKQADREYMLRVLDELRPCVDLLEPKLFENALITPLLFEVKWHMHHAQHTSVLERLGELLIDLSSAYGHYAHRILSMLIKLFTVASIGNEQLEQQQQCLSVTAVHLFSHNVIGSLLRTAPSCKPHLLKQADSIFPYMIKESSIQEAYIRNILVLAGNFAEMRSSLVELCVQRMLKLDVNSTREQIIEAEANEKQDITEKQAHPMQQQSMKHPYADRLDVMMLNKFEFIKRISFKQPAETGVAKVEASSGATQLDWHACKCLYKELLYSFDKYILCTYGSSHVQFLLFYICSLKRLLSEGFLDYLWKKFNCAQSTSSSSSSCAVVRQVCAYYMGSYLARAKYISTNTCVAALQLMVKWLHSYIDKVAHLNLNVNDFELNRTFYALCQTVLYVIVFRSKQLFGDDETAAIVASWKLNEIISSKLNPLRYCLPTICAKFAQIAQLNQIAYCYSIIDVNNRVRLPISGQNGNNSRMFFSASSISEDTFFSNDKNKMLSNELAPGAEAKGNTKNFWSNPLDSFFPFDPYLLKRSKLYIEKIYQEFQNNDSDDDDDDDDDNEIEDDIEEDEGESENEQIGEDIEIQMQTNDQNKINHFLNNIFKMNINDSDIDIDQSIEDEDEYYDS
jgi:RNA polymerase I-specific transcription initiation factor RRN3